jgi:phage gp46-like protein
MPITDNTPLEVPRRYRASWVSSSIQTLRRHGHYTRYRTLLDDYAREPLAELSASGWISAELVMAHYDACDRLQLGASELATLGVGTRLAIGNTLHVALRIATGAGLVSPWTLLAERPSAS